LLLTLIISGCKFGIKNEATSEETTSSDTATVVTTEIQTEQETVNTTENIDYHYLSIDDIIKLPFYLSDLTVDKAKEKEFEQISESSGDVFKIGSILYTFSDFEPGPIQISIISNEDNFDVMGIRINDTFEEALSKVPNDYKWDENTDNLIYGRMPDNTSQEYPFHGNAHILYNGDGTLTLVPEERFPFVQFIFNDFKVIRININCYEL